MKKSDVAKLILDAQFGLINFLPAAQQESARSVARVLENESSDDKLSRSVRAALRGTYSRDLPMNTEMRERCPIEALNMAACMIALDGWTEFETEGGSMTKDFKGYLSTSIAVDRPFDFIVPSENETRADPRLGYQFNREFALRQREAQGQLCAILK